MQDEMYDKAKLEKLKELRRLLREILASEGDKEMSEGEMEGVMEEAGDSAGDHEAMESEMKEGMEESMVEEPEDELMAMKREYFKPQKKEPMEKKGVAISVIAPPKPPMGMQPKKKGKA